MNSFLNIGKKLRSIIESRNILYGKERVKAENIRNALGITYPTYLKYKNEDIEPSEVKVGEIVLRLNGWTNISPKIAAHDFSDKVPLEEFCKRFSLAVPQGSAGDANYVGSAERRRLREDHPFSDFNLNLREGKSALRQLSGTYRLLRNNAKGAPILQSIVRVNGLLSFGKKVQIISSLSVPSINTERARPYYYTGVICVNREVYYWFFNQDDPYRRDFIILVTTKNGDRGFGGEYVSIGQDYFAIPQSGIVGMERVEKTVASQSFDKLTDEQTRVILPADDVYLAKLGRLHELNSISGRGA